MPAEARVQRWYQGAPSPFDCTQTRPKLPRLARIGDVALVQQHGREPLPPQPPGDGGADQATAHHDRIEGIGLHGREGTPAGQRRQPAATLTPARSQASLPLPQGDRAMSPLDEPALRRNSDLEAALAEAREAYAARAPAQRRHPCEARAR